MTVFWIIGAAGFALFAISLLVGDLLDGLFDALDFGGAGIVSTASVGGFAAAFGLVGAGVSATDAGPVTASLAGAAAGVLFGAIAVKLTRTMQETPTDRAPSGDDLVGADGLLVTGIDENGYGEVSVTIGGHRLKLNARADEPIPTGAQVTVVASLSATAVRVRAN